MPSPNALGQVLAGVAGIQSSIDGVLIPVLGGAQWETDQFVVGQSLDATRIVLVRASDQTIVQTLAPHGASAIVAGGGRWASFLQPDGGAPSQLDGALGAIAGAYLYACGPDGTIAWKRVYQDPAGLTLSSTTARIDLPSANPRDLQVLSSTEAVWSEAPGVYGAIGRAIPQPAVLTEHYRLVTTPDGVDWLIVEGQAGGLVVHPDGDPHGYVLVPVGQPAYNAEATLVNGELFITWAVVDREIPSDVRSVTVDRTQPRVDVRLTPISKPCAVGFYDFGGLNDAPGNVVLDVSTGHLIRRDTGEVIAQYAAAASDSDVDQLDAAIAAKHAADPTLPVLAYWTAQAQQIRVPVGADILGVEAYCHVDEAFDAFEARVRAAIARGPAVIQIAQAYTSNANNTTDLVDLVPIYERIAASCPNVLGIVAFSAGTRATGYADHPEIHDAWSQVAASVTGVPTFPQPSPTPPVRLPEPVPPVVPAGRFLGFVLPKGSSMTGYVLVDGQWFVGVNPTPTPGKTGDAQFVPYYNRPAPNPNSGGAWEQVSFEQHGAWWAIKFAASNRYLSIQQDGSLQTRAAVGGAYEQFDIYVEPVTGRIVIYRADVTGIVLQGQVAA